MGGGISKEQLEQRHVVVVGGGYGGVELATILLKWEVPFTLVDPKDYFHHCVGSLRAVLEPGQGRRMRMHRLVMNSWT